MVNLLLSFIVNFIILSTFLSLVHVFYPLGGEMLYQVFHTVGIAYTTTHVIYLYSFVGMVIMCILAKTPLAEQLACFSVGCRALQEENATVLNRAMYIVCEQAGISQEQFHLHEIPVPYANAMAIGRNNIAVTSAALQWLSVDELAGILAHEVGHIEHHDTKSLLMAYAMDLVGNLIIRIYNVIIQVCAILSRIPFVGLFMGLISIFFSIQVWILAIVLRFPRLLATRFMSRQNEYDADAYACEIGLGRQLYYGLAKVTAGEGQMPFYKRIVADHPDTQKRLKRIAAYVQQ
jgi:STE24 endopeptidase